MPLSTFGDGLDVQSSTGNRRPRQSTMEVIGQATPEEAQELAEEGIEFHALPVLPDDRN